MRVSLETAAPLSISRGKSTGNELRATGRIPGATWRGAVAAHVIAERDLGATADQDAGFRQIFLSGEVRFGDLRIEGRRPWPLSARGCTRDDEHPVMDVLIDTALGRPLPVSCAERDCGAKIGVPREEFYQGDQYGRTMPAGPRRRITAHTAIAGRTLRVREEQLFSMEVLERNQEFEGEVWASEAAAETLRGTIGEGVRLSLGRGGTRGQGDGVLKLVEEQDREAEQLRARLQTLSAIFEERGEIVFTCTLSSPMLVFDEWLLARSWMEAGDIEDAAGEPDGLAGYEVAACYSGMAQISGWNAQAELPKSDVWAIAPGSAFLFRRKYQGDREAEIARVAALLAKAEAGIGERWEEGMGEVVFCDAFHLEQRREGTEC